MIIFIIIIILITVMTLSDPIPPTNEFTVRRHQCGINPAHKVVSEKETESEIFTCDFVMKSAPTLIGVSSPVAAVVRLVLRQS